METRRFERYHDLCICTMKICEALIQGYHESGDMPASDVLMEESTKISKTYRGVIA